MLAAEIIVWTFIAYVAAGVLFGVYFVVAGAPRLDASAKGSGLGFRLIILPGTVAFSPLLIFRLAKGKSRPVESNSHRESAAASEGTE
jgi:hypothetical protein